MTIRHRISLPSALLVALLLCVVPGCIHNYPATDPPIAHIPPRAPERTPAAGPDDGPAPPPPAREPFVVRLRYLATGDAQQIIAAEGLVLTTPDQGLQRLPAGTWRIVHRATGGAVLDYPVYVKGFAHNETRALAAERGHWQAQGYSPFVTTMGRAVTASDGTVYDGRSYWLGIKRCQSESEVEGLKRTLQGQKVWAWSREEVRVAPKGTVNFQDASGATVLSASLPLRVQSTGNIALQGARNGKSAISVPGPLIMSFNRAGQLAIDGEMPLESYLEGILPAEMYPSWPLEALKAQAVAARSEVIVHAAGKHYFDGFDFCIEQHCRAFHGDEGRHERTDQAVRETADLVLINGENAIVPTVFSANCGGWTENNENVWDGAPSAALRGRSDRVGHRGQEVNQAVASWISSNPAANCSHDTQYYRWTRSLPLGDLSKRLDSQYGIGSLQRVEEIERGVSGRLKAIRLVGSRKSEVVRKELNIRRTFDNLPSALCTINVDGKSGTVHVRGAGRGHGVGLCQQGACGMARANQSYDAILRHYFDGVKISRI